MPPGPPRTPQTITREPGESDYAYRKRRSVALTGETPYQRRIRLGRARGLSVTEARGQRPGEFARRRERTIQQTGYTPYQIWRGNQIQWLVDNGFMPETTGWSWNQLIRAAAKIRYMNEQVSAFNQITPELLADGVYYGQEIGVNNWSPQQLDRHYSDIYEYYENRNPTGARQTYYYFKTQPAQPAVQWWYYR